MLQICITGWWLDMISMKVLSLESLHLICEISYPFAQFFD